MLVDGASGSVLYARRASATGPVASLQKLLAALLVVQAGDSEGVVAIEAADLDIAPDLKATIAGLRIGRRYRRQDLLEAMLIGSANDAALALARDHSGGSAPFAEAMNGFAPRLGMRTSCFLNPHGLPAEGQYSSAEDMAALALAIDAEPRVRSIVARRDARVVSDAGDVVSLTNTNRLLGVYDGCDGMKTGFTRRSGACLIASANTPAGRRIAIVLNSTPDAVWDDARLLLDAGDGR